MIKYSLSISYNNRQILSSYIMVVILKYNIKISKCASSRPINDLLSEGIIMGKEINKIYKQSL